MKGNTMHTPGPWTIRRGFSGWGMPRTHAILSDTAESAVALVESVTPYPLGPSVEERTIDAQAMADCHLIAAAPDLLEALRRVSVDLGCLAGWVMSTHENAQHSILVEEALNSLDACRVVISKAEGR